MKSEDIEKMSDRAYLAEARGYSDYAVANFAALGLTQAEALAMKAELDELEADLDARDKIIAEKKAAVSKKRATRNRSMARLRRNMRTTRAQSGITDATLSAANLDVLKQGRSSSVDLTTSDSVPIAIVEYGRLRHTLRIRDAARMNSGGKPKGALGCEIWIKMGGEAPLDEREFRYVALATRQRFVMEFDGEDGGKLVHYLLRWIGRGDKNKGTWSEVVSATVNA